MALLLIHALTGGRWGEAHAAGAARSASRRCRCCCRRWSRSCSCCPALYPWAQPEAAAHLPNAFYLNVPFCPPRLAVYLVVWLGLGLVALLGGRAATGLLRAAAPPGLILLALTVTFAAIDLTMSLDPHFNSSVYGMLTGAGMVLLALSVALLLAAPVADARARDDLGRLLLALVRAVGLSRLHADR